MGLKDFFSKRKTSNALENAYYSVIESWMEVEYMLKKDLITSQDAIGLLNAVCKDARKHLNDAKEQNVEVYNKYTSRFENLFNKIDSFKAELSADLQI